MLIHKLDGFLVNRAEGELREFNILEMFRPFGSNLASFVNNFLLSKEGLST